MTDDDWEQFWWWLMIDATVLACAWMVAWAVAVLP